MLRSVGKLPFPSSTQGILLCRSLTGKCRVAAAWPRLVRHLSISSPVFDADKATSAPRAPASGVDPGHHSSDKGEKKSSGDSQPVTASGVGTTPDSHGGDEDHTAGGGSGEGEQGDGMFEYSDPRLAILDSALAHVPTHGWTLHALAAGAHDLGYPAVAQGMFPRGAVELVEHFMADCNVAMSEHLHDLAEEDETFLASPIEEIIGEAVKTRLSYLEPYLKTWPQAMALGALPQNLPYTLQSLGELVDEIWAFAGDRSTDIKWYTRRGLLFTVYTSTELHMLTDDSPGFQDTWMFLDRRLHDVSWAGTELGQARSVAGAVAAGAESLIGATTTLAGPFLETAFSTASTVLPLPSLQAASSAVSSIGQAVAGAALSSPFPTASSQTASNDPFSEQNDFSNAFSTGDNPPSAVKPSSSESEPSPTSAPAAESGLTNKASGSQ